MWTCVRDARPRYFAGVLGICCLPSMGWGFFPPIDLYPAPATLPAPLVIVEQPIPPVPPEPIQQVVTVIQRPSPIMTPEPTPIPTPVTPQVPEPASVGMALFGLGSLICLRRRKRTVS